MELAEVRTAARELVISVPVAARGATTCDDLGNQVGVMPVRVPVHGPVADRLTAVAKLTRDRRTQAHRP